MAGFLNAIDLSARGLSVQRSKMDVVAENIANAETTETKEGGPYRRKRLVVTAKDDEGSFRTEMIKAGSRLAHTNSRHISGRSINLVERNQLASVDKKVVEEPKSKFKLVYDPSHPDADADGYVKMPDVEIVTEMVDMMAASRAYEANTVAIAAAKKMARDSLEI